MNLCFDEFRVTHSFQTKPLIVTGVYWPFNSRSGPSKWKRKIKKILKTFCIVLVLMLTECSGFKALKEGQKNLKTVMTKSEFLEFLETHHTQNTDITLLDAFITISVSFSV